MNSNDFENELKSRAFRKIPDHWREQILANARENAEVEGSPRSSGAALPWWRELFWPNPVAWGTLAAAWLVILCFRFAAVDTSSQMSAAPDYAKLKVAIEQKRELYAELTETASQPPSEPPKPRSQSKSPLRSA